MAKAHKTSLNSLSTRRRFFQQSGRLLLTSSVGTSLGATLAGTLVAPSVIAADTSALEPLQPPAYRGIAASGKTLETFALGQFNQQNNQRLTSDFRGHGLAFHPAHPNAVIMVERRPGHRISMISLVSGEVIQNFLCSDDHYLCGHACFSADGLYLMCSQADKTTHQGSIAVFEVSSGQQRQQWSTHGIEPHELILDPTGQKLYIANGGLIRTQDGTRRLLNRSTMASSLVILDAETGLKLDKLVVDLPFTSLRHLAIANDQTLSLAMQYQAPANIQDASAVPTRDNLQSPTAPVVVAATYHPERGITALPALPRVWELCQGYIGSTAICSATQTAAFTSPKGNVVAFWHYPSQELTAIYRLHDVCGVSVTPDQDYFVVTNSQGSVRYLAANSLRENRQLRQKFTEQDWDNHLLMIPSTSNRMST